MSSLSTILDDKSRDRLVAVLDALRVPDRIRIMEMIAASRQSVSTRQLVDALGISASSLSHHLKALTQVGLIARGKRIHGTVMVTTDGATFRVTVSMLARICRTAGWVTDPKSDKTDQRSKS